jgi:hypothetical protein
MFKIRLQDVRINPLRIGSGFFLLLAPFAAWMTLSTFGFVTESNLWEIANSQTSFPISPGLASSALYTSILLILGGFVSLRSAKFGLPLAAFAFLIFGVESYSTFGSFPNAIPVSILPGLGVFLVIAGMVLGLGSLRGREISVVSLLHSIQTPKGLEQTGVFVTIIALAADGWNHWASSQLSGFLGETLIEGIIHRVFLFGAAALLTILLIQKNLGGGKLGGILVVSTFSALVLDAVYHITNGSVVSFVGHDPTELLLHAVAYYGIASLVIARLLLRR